MASAIPCQGKFQQTFSMSIYLILLTLERYTVGFVPEDDATMIVIKTIDD
jgi:hypothetical protein